MSIDSYEEAERFIERHKSGGSTYAQSKEDVIHGVVKVTWDDNMVRVFTSSGQRTFHNISDIKIDFPMPNPLRISRSSEFYLDRNAGVLDFMKKYKVLKSGSEVIIRFQ